VTVASQVVEEDIATTGCIVTMGKGWTKPDIIRQTKGDPKHTALKAKDKPIRFLHVKHALYHILLNGHTLYALDTSTVITVAGEIWNS